MKLFITVFLIIITISLHGQDENSSTKDTVDVSAIIKTFVGEWEGEATAFFPRKPDRPNRNEKVNVVCKEVLEGNYIECNTKWAIENGRTRKLLIFWTYNKKTEKFNILFLYDDWPEIVNYPLDYDPQNRIFRGIDNFTTSRGIKGEEHVEWEISADSNVIKGTEYNHYENDPKDYWPKSFEFTWRRKN